ncbi:MAG: hypothetical protein ACPGNV_09045 [Mangrovicoccus sp.]
MIPATPALAGYLGQNPGLNGWFGSCLLIALLLGGLSALGGYIRFGLLAGFFVMGSAGRLLLLPDIWFPAISITPVTLGTVLAAAALTAQGLVTCLILWQERTQIYPVLGVFRHWVGGGAVLTLLALTSVSPTIYVAYGHLPSYAVQIILGGMMAALHLASLGALLLLPGPKLPSATPGKTAILAAFLALVASTFLALFSFQAIPHVGDDLAYLFQAKTWAQGALTAPAPPEALQPGLEYYLLTIRENAWIGTTAPGYPLLLTLGVLAGASWAVNPILTALAILLSFDILRRSSLNLTVATLTAWLMASSPWVLATGAAYMTHMTALVMALLGWWCLVRGGFNLGQGTEFSRLSMHWALAAGLAMGWLFTTRQFEGVVIGGLTGCALLTLRPRPWSGIIAYGIGCLATGMVYFAYNFAITGDPLNAPLVEYLRQEWSESRNAFGFGPDIGAPAGSWGALDFQAGHSLFEGLVNTVNGFAALNIEASGWATGSLLGLGLFAVHLRNWRMTRAGWFLLLITLCTIGAMVFYWFAGTFYVGPRYWFILALPLFLASATGVYSLAYSLPPDITQRLWTVTALLCLTGLTTFTPWRGVSKYYQFRENYAGLVAPATRGDFGNSLVFVSYPEGEPGDIESALFLNDPFLSGDKPIFLRDLGELQNAAVMATMPERPAIYVQLRADGITMLRPPEN